MIHTGFSMYFGYNTNGLAHHAFSDAVELLSRLGFQGVAVTLDHDLLERRGNDFFWRTPLDEICTVIKTFGMRSVVETGARFLLDPQRKHHPNLLDVQPEQRKLRQKYYRFAVQLAEKLGSDCVSIWSGAAADPDELADILFRRLAEELRILTNFAEERGVKIAFEPEPGMFIDTMRQFERLLEFAPSELRLTLDVGHLFCQYEPIPEQIRRHSERLVNIHFEDSVRGIHEHLLPGEGGINFTEFFQVLNEIQYTGGVFAELSRHSASGAETAERVWNFMKRF